MQSLSIFRIIQRENAYVLILTGLVNLEELYWRKRIDIDSIQLRMKFTKQRWKEIWIPWY